MAATGATLPETLARRLDVSVVRLMRREKQLVRKLGVERVLQLRNYSDKVMDPCREEAFKRGMDLNDRELVWIWRMVRKARDEQVEAWREAVLSGQGVESPIPPLAEEVGNRAWARGRRRGRVHGRVDPETVARIVGMEEPCDRRSSAGAGCGDEHRPSAG